MVFVLFLQSLLSFRIFNNLKQLAIQSLFVIPSEVEESKAMK